MKRTGLVHLLAFALCAINKANASDAPDEPRKVIASALVRLAFDGNEADLTAIGNALQLPGLRDQDLWTTSTSANRQVQRAGYAPKESSLGIVQLHASRLPVSGEGVRTGLSLLVDAANCPSGEDFVLATDGRAAAVTSNADQTTMRLPTRNQDVVTLSLTEGSGATVDGRTICAILIDRLPAGFIPAHL